jgi:hypothetical protein
MSRDARIFAGEALEWLADEDADDCPLSVETACRAALRSVETGRKVRRLFAVTHPSVADRCARSRPAAGPLTTS